MQSPFDQDPNNSLNSPQQINNFVLADLSDFPDDTPEEEITYQLIKGLGQTLNPINMAFFSRTNREIIQNAIRRRVYTISKGKYNIAPQHEQELMIIMREIYKEPVLAREHIRNLNEMIIDRCVVQVIRTISGYMQYLADQSRGIQPMSKPLFTSRTGTRGGNGIIPNNKQF
jgi:hypothetical protein